MAESRVLMSTPQSERLSIVVVGQFNPAIVSPIWLETELLISKESASAAELEVITPEISSFRVASMHVQVLRERLAVTTTDAREEEVIRDLVIGILELLHHTPTAKVGLNYEARFALSSPTAWHAKGHELAPKEPWKELMRKPGLVNVTMRDNSRSDGHLDVSVGPAREPKNALAVTTNDHYELVEANAAAACEIIASQWKDSLARSREIAVALAVEQEG